jgi:hypothetical protein
MDVEAIPFAVSFPDYIKDSIGGSRVLIALIGANWAERIQEPGDPVRMEIEAAIANNIQVLPVLVGNTPMPNPDKLPASISNIALQNAQIIGVSHDFDTHMQMLLPRIESILATLASQSVVTSNVDMIPRACQGVIRYLGESVQRSEFKYSMLANANWQVVGTDFFSGSEQFGVTFFLHRVSRLADLLELHFILSFWSRQAPDGQALVGWVMRQLEQNPLIPDEFFWPDGVPDCTLKVRHSDEDAREVWKMITNEPLRLSLCYVATISPKKHG